MQDATVTELDALAQWYGIESSFLDARGETRETSPATKRALLAAFGAAAATDEEARASLERVRRAASARVVAPVQVVTAGTTIVVPMESSPSARARWHLHLEDGSERDGAVDAARGAIVIDGDVPLGYHDLTLTSSADRLRLIVTPGRCVPPPPRSWGLAVQLYLLRSAENWGIGDFGDLRALVGIVRRAGGDIVGLNPLHALFLDEPEHASPYSPASRLLLNVLNIDVTAMPEFATSVAARQHGATPAFRALLERVRASERVRYADVAAAKLPMLRILFEERPTSGARADAFAAFVREGGEALRRSCLFQVLRSSFGADRSAWPSEYARPESTSVDAFAAEHRDELAFMQWLQWIADEQLAAAADAARGMRVGLYRDLAVGADRNGAEAWSNAGVVAASVSVGAPPDIYNPNGQNWGLPPFHPMALRDEAYRSFIELVRANMRHAGAIRIDHAMALQHLYLIPPGCEPNEGAYVRYPLDDLIGILALESHRHGCVVIGEDLGTVPPGFRERMADANILSYRVLFFESDARTGTFVAPDAYPSEALAVVGSHDLPTLPAWWRGEDIEQKHALGLLNDDTADEQRAERARAKTGLLQALTAAGLLAAEAPDDDALAIAVHAYLARSCAALAMAQIDDVADERDPVNVPTTADEHNWRRRVHRSLDDLEEDGRFRALAAAMRRERDTVTG